MAPRLLCLVLALAACERKPPRAPDIAVAPAPATAAPRAGDLPPSPPPPAVTAMVEEVSADRVRAIVDRLAGFGTRHTLSADAPDRGIEAARRWLQAELAGYSPRLQVDLDVHPYAPDGRRVDTPVDIVNVLAVLPGSSPVAAHRRYYVIGHYDSRASDPMDRTTDAPGADDDASGVAVVLELARVMSQHEHEATLVFMATAGEEQGLLGARAHAESAAAQGADIRAVLSNDIVGDPTAPDGSRHDHEVRLFSEGLPTWLLDEQLAAIRRTAGESDGPSRQLARFIDAVARWHALPVQPRLVFRHDRFLRGGDHTAFNEQGFAAVRFTEVGEHYDRQHQDPRVEDGHRFGDDPQAVDEAYLADVARLDLAALAHLANAPSIPGDARIVARELTSDTTLRWKASPEPDVAGYEIVWRATTEPTWTHARDVGNVTEATVELHKDDWLFGVRAYDEDGYRSPVAFPGIER